METDDIIQKKQDRIAMIITVALLAGLIILFFLLK